MKRAKLSDLQILELSADFRLVGWQEVERCRCGRVLPSGGNSRLVWHLVCR